MAVQIQLRNDTASNWTSANPTLAAGEIGIETNTGKMKLGNGSTAWNSLGYFEPSSLDGLSDVTITSASTGQVVQYNGSAWVNSAITVSEISDLTATATELNYVDGVTSAIQTQLDSKANTLNPSFTGQLALSAQFPGIEMKSTGSGFPYIDFGDATTDDFDVRMSMPAATRRIVLEPAIDNGERSLRNIFTSTSTPSGTAGADGDVWFQYTP